jgi:hypothetical protein
LVKGIFADELSYWPVVPPCDQSRKMEYTRWHSTLLNEMPFTDGRVMMFIHGYANRWTEVIDTTVSLAAILTPFSIDLNELQVL